jgi:hypothetical protein
MYVKDRKTTKAFRACENKGFHVTFQNGWTVSVQWGSMNYCDNFQVDLGKPIQEILDEVKCPRELESDTAEVWGMKGKQRYPRGGPLEYQTPAQVLQFMIKLAKKRGR